MIGSKVREKRLALGMTQEELAHKMGYKSKSTINKIEKDVNDVTQSTLIRLAHVLGCEPMDFFDQKEAALSANGIEEHVRLYQGLSPEAQAMVTKYIEFLSKEEAK